MHFGIHYLIKKRGFDRLAYVAAFLGPILTIPQMIKIWGEKSATGVSIITWLGYFGGAIFWLIYGYLHREKPIIVANLSLGILAFLIIVGILLYGKT